MESGETGQIAAEEKSIWSFLPKQISPYLFVLIVVCLVAFGVEAYFVSQIKFIGSADPANFANVANNLLKGNGFVMDYINEYFIKFDTITHPEEYGFPLVSIVLAPFIYIFGKTAFAVKLPFMLIMAIFLPVVTYFLGKEVEQRRPEIEQEFIKETEKRERIAFEKLEPYQSLKELETNLRLFIEEKLKKVTPHWWKERIPQDVQEKAEENMSKNESPWPWVKTEERTPIFYINFPDYGKIILSSLGFNPTSGFLTSFIFNSK